MKSKLTTNKKKWLLSEAPIKVEDVIKFVNKLKPRRLWYFDKPKVEDEVCVVSKNVIPLEWKIRTIQDIVGIKEKLIIERDLNGKVVGVKFVE